MKGNSLGNRLRRKDILPPFRMFYSLGVRWWQGTQLAWALDATSLGQRCVGLAVRVV